MSCEIEWLQGNLEPWVRAFHTTRRSTLLQHLPYAIAVRELQQLGMRHGMIHANGSPVGVVQIGEAGILGNAVHVVSLDRGPLFFEDEPAGELVASFFREFRRQFGRRWGRKLRIIPEVEGDAGKAMIESCGFRRKPRIGPYRTAWLDLTPGADQLRSSLKGKWRNALNKAERSPVEAIVDRRLLTLPDFLAAYERDMQEKGYAGPSVSLVATLVKHMRERDEVLLINAVEEGSVIASVVIFMHGLAATYQCGWTTAWGRGRNAHHLLLWDAVLHLKDRGVLDLDLGGLLADSDEAGLRRFKLGLGAREIELAGAFG